MTTNSLPATQGFSGVSLANMDLNRFRQGLEIAQQNIAVTPGMQFLRMTRSGAWVFGQDSIEVQEGSEWAINPLSLEAGFVAWGTGGGKPLGKVLRTILQPPILPTELPNVGAEWTDIVSFKLRCLNGEDAGTECEFSTNSRGGMVAFGELVGLLKAQIDLDASRMIPVVRLESESYRNQYGQIFNPQFPVMRWVAESELPVLPNSVPPPEQAAPTPAPAVFAATLTPTPAPAVVAATLTPTPAPAVVAATPAPRRGRPPLNAAPVADAPAPAATTGRRRRGAI